MGVPNPDGIYRPSSVMTSMVPDACSGLWWWWPSRCVMPRSCMCRMDLQMIYVQWPAMTIMMPDAMAFHVLDRNLNLQILQEFLFCWTRSLALTHQAVRFQCGTAAGSEAMIPLCGNIRTYFSKWRWWQNYVEGLWAQGALLFVDSCRLDWYK